MECEKHDYYRDREYRNENKILGTYDIGHINKCRTCGREYYVRERYNNWSGD